MRARPPGWAAADRAYIAGGAASQSADGGHPAALADQQLAGVLMWSAGGIVYTIAGATLFATWLHTTARALTPRRSRT